MRMKFRVRIVVLLCFVAFSLWVILSFHGTGPDCSPDGKVCTKKSKKPRNRAKEDGYVDPNAQLMIGRIKDKIDEDIRDDGYREYAFNDLISRRLGHHRAIPDTRHEM